MHWPETFIPQFGPAAPPESGAYLFAFMGEDLVLRETNDLPTAATTQMLNAADPGFLCGELDGLPCNTCSVPPETDLPPGLKAVSLRYLHGLLQPGYWGIAARAKQMLAWDKSSRFCGACGTATQAANGEPCKICPACDNRDFPRISPAVIVIVRRGDKLLLARSPHFRAGMYSALAGFVEAGESVEACLHREVFEEVGIRIHNLRWFDSQTWPFPNSLMLAFQADYLSGEIVPEPGEIEDAAWFALDELPDLPYPVSIAHRLILASAAEIENERAEIRA